MCLHQNQVGENDLSELLDLHHIDLVDLPK